MADGKPSLDPDHGDVDIDDPDNPELTEEDFAKMRPFKEVFPEMNAKLEADRAAGVKPTVHYLKTVEVALPEKLFEEFAGREKYWRTSMEEMLEASIRAALAEPPARKRA